VITIPKPYGQTHGRTYGLTDRQTTCRSNTTLCVALRDDEVELSFCNKETCRVDDNDEYSVCM